MKFYLVVTPKNPRMLMNPRAQQDGELGPVVALVATDEAAALVEAKTKMMAIQEKAPLSHACLCAESVDLLADLNAAVEAKTEAAEKALLAKLKAKHERP